MEIKKLINKMISEEIKKYIKKPLNEDREEYVNNYLKNTDDNPNNISVGQEVENKRGVSGEVVDINDREVQVRVNYNNGTVRKPYIRVFDIEDLFPFEEGSDEEYKFGFDDWVYDFNNVENTEAKEELYNKLKKISDDMTRDPEYASSAYSLNDNDDSEEVKNEISKVLKYMESKLNNNEGEIDENSGESYEEKINRLDDMTEVDGEDEEDMQESREMCECGGELNEGLCESCGKGLNENVLRLTKSEMKKLLNTLILESSVPGVSVTKNATNQSKKNNEDNIKEVTKKLKSQKIDDPFKETKELPKPNEGEKKARKNTKEQESEIEEDRGYGMEDINFDVEPSEEFKKRMRLAILGDPSMGNSQEYANVIKSDLGKNIIDKSERLRKKDEDKPMYDKDPLPVKIVSEEIDKIKNLFNYNKKTQ